MSRYLDSVCKLCRREGEKLFLKGSRCHSPKCSIERRAYPPGEHGQKSSKVKEYGRQLREKQKAKRIYGVLEKQFRRYYLKAARQKGIVGQNLVVLLERRLDNLVYRLGFASSRSQARQLVKHNHFLVNGKRANIPSYSVPVGGVIQVRETSRNLAIIGEALETGSTQRDTGLARARCGQTGGSCTGISSSETGCCQPPNTTDC